MIEQSSKLIKGILKNMESGWVIHHDIIDPYGQIPHPIPIYPTDNENLIEGIEVEFHVVYEYYGKIK